MSQKTTKKNSGSKGLNTITEIMPHFTSELILKTNKRLILYFHLISLEQPKSWGTKFEVLFHSKFQVGLGFKFGVDGISWTPGFELRMRGDVCVMRIPCFATRDNEKHATNNSILCSKITWNFTSSLKAH